ncbi:Nut1p [Sugiyamaella lignohabitans]|uniref:Mediator of RNA polymerase II transcription subunit 5 n=1 Tax=Sugiyamaella lignohabitans TaxID=796027 RepID=A0A167D9E0_9ASCO|nr:Nut1p [Sugiyamaella lignohabitans]ANB12642.1 Nut1p [Sugiyamaella lignohabitans]
MTQSLSSVEKLEKLVKACLLKRWNWPLFVKFCGQLQETCDFESSDDSGRGLFSAAVDTGPLDPLFLEYICALASDPKSLLPLPSLIQYLEKSSLNSRAKSDVLIFIAKSVGSWNNLGLSSIMGQLGSVLAHYMISLSNAPEKQQLLEFKALAYFLVKLAESGHVTSSLLVGQVSSDAGSDKTGFSQFQVSLKRVYGKKLIGKSDPYLEQLVKNSFKSILDDQSNVDGASGTDSLSLALGAATGINGTAVGTGSISGLGGSNTAIKNSRAYRILWLESLMLTVSKIQGATFIRELNIFFGGQNSLSIVSKLITTAFDCLAVALQRKDSPMYVPLWKGFIGKRLPLIIRRLQGNNDKSSSGNGDSGSDSSRGKDKDGSSSANDSTDPYPFESAICRPIAMLDRGTVNLLRVYGGGDVLDEMFSSFPSTTSDIRHEFLKACVDMGLIKPDSLQQTLGADANVVEDNTKPSYGPARSNFLLRKDGITQININDLFNVAFTENPEHVTFENSTILWLVQSFDNIDGYRQQRIARGLLKFVEGWADDSTDNGNQNTASLSRLCQALSLNTDMLDILFLHITPASLIVPLIKFLDHWKEDEDENDFQEVYSHLGSVILFIELVYERYPLNKDDLMTNINGQHAKNGTSPANDNSDDSMAVDVNGKSDDPETQNSFWLSCVLDGVRDAIVVDDMSEDRKVLLGGWISALYDSGGISDDLMRLSSIKELTLLVPSIFQQSIAACAAEIIDQDTLRGGLDYFLQPFLLPTLLAAFRYLSDCLWLSSSASQDLSHVLFVLVFLVSPSGLSPEATNIHKIILTIISSELKASLIDLKNRTSKEHNTIDQLLIALEPHVTSTGKFAPTIPSTNSLVTTIKDTINILVGWIQALDQGHISGAPGFVLGCFSISVDILGSRKLLDLFLDELDFAEAQGSFEYAMDVISGIVMIMDTLGEHDRRRKSDQIDSSLLELVESISDECVTQQRVQKRRDRTNATNGSSSAVNGTLTSTTAAATNTDLLIGSFQKLKKRISCIQAFRAQQEKSQPALTGNDDIDNEDDIADGLAVDALLESAVNLDGINNGTTSIGNGIANIQSGATSGGDVQPLTATDGANNDGASNDAIDPNGDLDTGALDDMNLMADLDMGMGMGMGEDELALGGGLDMSGFDPDEQLMLMDLT